MTKALSQRSVLTFAAWSLFASIMLITVPVQAQAPQISSASVSTDGTTLLIVGTGFGPSPTVILGTITLGGVVVNPAGTLISAPLPVPAPAAGTYLLRVCPSGACNSPIPLLGLVRNQSAEFTVTIGVSGATGPPGPTGPQGPAGLQGLAGLQGPAGSQGPAGPSGPQGATGAQGPIGPQGPAGPTGATGSAGPQGVQGPPGATGATGPPGPSGLIHFSTGIVLSGATVVSAAPILMGFGNHTVEVIDGSGESTMPPEAGGFSFPMPFAGTVQDLQISAELLAASAVSINTLGLQYDFTVFRAPSVPNSGIDHPSSPYVTTPLTSSVRFGFPNTVITPGTFRTATNINIGGSLVVAAGDRIGIRIRTNATTDPSAADITQLSFSATLSYTPGP
jgi:hypothetical protein